MLGSRCWAPPGFGTIIYLYIWMAVAIYWQFINKRITGAEQPPSQTLDSCVFHCKSAMKSSTLIWEWNFQPCCDGHEWNVGVGGPVQPLNKQKIVFFQQKSRLILVGNENIFTAFIGFSSANVSSGAHLFGRCLTLPFNSFPLSHTTQPPLLNIHLEVVILIISAHEREQGMENKLKNKYFLLKWRHVNH